MAFSPSDSPVYGGGRLVVTFSEATILPSDAQMYVLYEGSRQRHLTTANLINQHTVQAAIPGHDEAEDVTLTLWMCHHGNRQVLATSTFFYMYDTAYYMCQFLRDSVFDPAALEELELIRSEKFDLSEEQLSTLDERLSRAFAHLDIPEGWHILGLDSTVPEPPPRETLLHFAARLGLQRLATFLMEQTGSQEALRLPNRHGEYPVGIARGLGFEDLAKSLSGCSGSFGSWDRQEKVQVTHGSVVTRHGHGLTTLSTTVSKSSNTVGDDLEMLREFTTLIHDEPQKNHYHMDPGILQGRSYSASDGLAYSRYSNRYSLQLDNRSRAFSDGMALLEQEEEGGDDEDEEIFSPAPGYHHPAGHAFNPTHHYPPSHSPPQYSSSPGNPGPPQQQQHIHLHQYNQLNSGKHQHQQQQHSHQHLQNQHLQNQHPQHQQHAQRRYNKNQRYSPKQGSGWHGFHGNRPQSMPPMTTPTTPQSLGIPNISISSLGPKGPILEENLRRLHEISEGIIKLRQLNSSQLHVQDGRRENLSKFSTSCPSLNEPEHGSSLANINTDYYRSMLDLQQQESAAVTPSGEIMPSNMEYKVTSASDLPPVEPDVRICINDVTLDSTEDFIQQPPGGVHSNYEEEKNLLIEHYRRHPRRRSWCPEKTNVEKKEFRNKMLSISNRSLSLSSLDGQDDTDEENEDERLDDSNEMQSPDQSQSSVGGASEGNLSHSSLNGTLNSSDLTENLIPTANSTPSENSSRLTSSRSLSAGSATTPVRSMSELRLALDEAANQQASEATSAMAPFGGSGGGVHDADLSSSRGSLVLSGHPTLMKSVSTPSIPSLKEDDKTKDERRPGTINEVSAEGRSASVKEEEVDEDEALNELLQTDRRRKARMSMIEFLNDANNFDGGGSDQKQEVKEEKKRRSSVFSKFGSYRQKKLREKELKNRSTHQFVSVSFSNSKACNVCRRSMANKAALQCEHCMLNVHDSCKDQIATCAKYRDPHKLPQRTPSAPSEEARDRMTRFQSNSLPANNVFSVPTENSVKTSQSFREAKRALSVPSRSTHHHSLSTSALLPKNPSQRASSPRLISEDMDSYYKSKVINEERERENEREAAIQPVTNMTEAFSVSMESLDDGTSEVQDFEDDPVLMIKTKEEEAWSVTVDKKTLKKMSAKDIKRQDHIWEFIQTEKSHCRTLKIMKMIFSHGILHELKMGQHVIERLFPRLDDLLDIHTTFLRSLRERQQLKPDKSIDEIGDVLVQQFEGEMGSRMKEAYGEFCSRHNRAVDYYKEILKSERAFQTFVKKCSFNEVIKKLDIPACILLVTQRMTKYPLLIEPIIKTTKAKTMKNAQQQIVEIQRLQHALILTRHILDYVDAQIDACEKEERLYNIYYKLDPRSVATLKGQKFKKSDLLSNGKRKLIHEGTVSWKSARGKTTEVMAVLLSDLIFFMQESNQKYVFHSQDNKSSVISLSKLLVREKGDTRDSKGIYLICQSKSNPEMYEIVCRTQDERKQWIRIVRAAIANCPEEADESSTTEKEEEKRIMEEKSARLRQLIDVMKQKDTMISNFCSDKMKAMGDMMEIFGFGDLMNNLKSVYKNEEKTQFRDLDDLLQAATQEASRLSMMLQSHTSTLSRSVSSAGEHTSATYVTPPLPKRAETFGGFEGKEYPKGLASMPSESRKRESAGLADTETDGRSGSLQNLENPDSDNEAIMLTVDSAAGGANKEKINRRMSTSFLQHLLIKQHTEREESDTRLSDRSSDRGSWGELSSASSNTSVHHLPAASAHISREHCSALIHLMHYLHAAMSLSAQQKTQFESLKAQLSEANRKLSKHGSDTERRGTYHHDKQLEELRNLQETINREREAWEKEKEKGRSRQEEERAEIDQMRADIAKQQDELRLQREELQRQRDALQRQIDFYEQQKSVHANKSIDAPAVVTSKSAGPGVSNGRRSLDVLGAAVGMSNRAQTDIIHKRSASDDIQTMSRQGVGGVGEPEPYEPARAEYTGSLKEPLNVNREQQKAELKPRPHSVSSTSANSSVGVARRDSQLPIHLLSATNEQKLKQVKQQLPFKLLAGGAGSGGGGGVSAGAPTATPPSGGLGSTAGGAHHTSPGSGSGGGGGGPQQMLPMKLSGLSSSSQLHPGGGNIGGVQKTTPTAAGGPGGHPHPHHHHPALVKSTSHVYSKTQATRLTSVHSTPSLLSKSRTLHSPPSATQTLLPMKLAEGSAIQRAKSASPQILPRHTATATSATNNATTSTAPSTGQQQNSHKTSPSNIKEEEVIYF